VQLSLVTCGLDDHPAADRGRGFPTDAEALVIPGERLRRSQTCLHVVSGPSFNLLPLLNILQTVSLAASSGRRFNTVWGTTILNNQEPFSVQI
jgi:hypothetical protein